ncbi:unnamed protein product, partial [Pleuronectes platessa]
MQMGQTGDRTAELWNYLNSFRLEDDHSSHHPQPPCGCDRCVNIVGFEYHCRIFHALFEEACIELITAEVCDIISNARRFGVATASGVTSQAPARQGLAATLRRRFRVR